MRAHTDEEIITKAAAVEKDFHDIPEDRIDITVDLDDAHGITHTYVVNFCMNAEGKWQPAEVSELSSL